MGLRDSLHYRCPHCGEQGLAPNPQVADLWNEKGCIRCMDKHDESELIAKRLIGSTVTTVGIDYDIYQKYDLPMQDLERMKSLGHPVGFAGISTWTPKEGDDFHPSFTYKRDDIDRLGEYYKYSSIIIVTTAVTMKLTAKKLGYQVMSWEEFLVKVLNPYLESLPYERE